MMEMDKTFNLQLTIQKLEEELSLYRNGTTAEEMFEIIKEKETEIEQLKSKLTSKDETLRKIAKSSGDVLTKYDTLIAEKEKLVAETQTFTARYNQLQEQLQSKTHESSKIKSEYEMECSHLTSTITELTESNGRLKSTLQTRDSRIDALTESIMRFEQQVEAMKENDQQVLTLRKALSEKEGSLRHLQECLTDSDASIEKLQKRCADLVSEKAEKFRQLDQERQDMINHVQKFRESMATNITQRDEALRRKEDKIKELGFQITVLTQDAKLKAGRADEIAAERDAHWAGRVTELEARLHETEKRLSATNNGRSEGTALSSVLKSENESLRARIMSLEERLHRAELDNSKKRAVLRDRSLNVLPLHYDPADLAAKPAGVRAASSASNEVNTATGGFSIFADK